MGVLLNRFEPLSRGSSMLCPLSLFSGVLVNAECGFQISPRAKSLQEHPVAVLLFHRQPFLPSQLPFSPLPAPPALLL